MRTFRIGGRKTYDDEEIVKEAEVIKEPKKLSLSKLDKSYLDKANELATELYLNIDTINYYLNSVETDIEETREKARKIEEAVEELSKLIEDDLSFEKEYSRDSEDSQYPNYRLSRQNNTYLIMNGNKVLAEYEDRERALRNLKKLQNGENPIDKI